MDLGALSIDELDSRLVELARNERTDLKTFLAHLIEFHKQRGAESKAYSNLYAYCRERLLLSEGESFRRVHAARKAAEIPEILDSLESGAVTLSSLNVLIPHMTRENAAALLAEAAGKSKRDAEFIAARLAPKAEAPDFLRSLSGPATQEIQVPGSPSRQAAPATTHSSESGGPAAGKVEVLTEKFVKIAFTMSRATLRKLERARGLLRHKHPKGEFQAIFDEALEALLDRIDRARKPKPAPERPVLPGRRRIPEWVKDAVYARDRGRCAFQSVDGRRCETAEWLEFDHVRPFALGGLSDDPDNVRLLCRAHNQHRAREEFGEGEWSGGTF